MSKHEQGVFNSFGQSGNSIHNVWRKGPLENRKLKQTPLKTLRRTISIASSTQNFPLTTMINN